MLPPSAALYRICVDYVFGSLAIMPIAGLDP